VIRVEIPGGPTLELECLLLDVNGTVSNRGTLIPGVREHVDALRGLLELRLLSADTFGTVRTLATELGVESTIVGTGEAKLELVRTLGASRCVAVGNGSNDVAMLREAALGIAVVGPEGASIAALMASDVVCTSIVDALELLRDERALVATLRS
jgi:P-type E1-E2 ATPase